jgi:hypothetical protein
MISLLFKEKAPLRRTRKTLGKEQKYGDGT